VFLDMNMPRTCTETFRRSYQETSAKHEELFADRTSVFETGRQLLGLGVELLITLAGSRGK
jgi:hypothetical protein